MSYPHISVCRHYNKIPASVYHCQSELSIQRKSEISTDYSQEIKHDIIVVKISRLKILLQKHRQKEVSQQDIINSLQSDGLSLKQQFIKQQLTPQVSLINKIKQNNQKILKNRIRQLQAKLNMSSHIITQNQNSQSSQPTIFRLNQDISLKDKKIGELQSTNKLLQLKIEGYQLKLSRLQVQINRMQKQTVKLRAHIKQQQQAIIKSKDIKQNCQHKHIQIGRQANLSIKGKLVQLKVMPIIVQISQLESTEQFESQLCGQIQILENTNSALRKQLIKLHDYLQLQDEKYKNIIENLQQKIKKLTQFNSKSKQKLRSSSLSCNSNTNTHRNYEKTYQKNYGYSNSNRQSYSILGQEKQPNNHINKIVKLANFNIELQFQNPNQLISSKLQKVKNLLRTVPNSQQKYSYEYN